MEVKNTAWNGGPITILELIKPLIQNGKKLAAGLLLLGLAACATAPETFQQAGIQNFKKGTYNRNDADAVVTLGFESIAQKHIRPVKVSEMAMEAMRGLGAIDPAISVRQVGTQVIVYANEEELSRFEAPPPDSAQGWARIALDATEAGRMWSTDLRQASAERIYETLFDGALSLLDIYSRYDGNRAARENRAKRHGFGGIGIRFKSKNGQFFISKIMDAMPAGKVGVRVGDEIVRIDGMPVKGMGRYLVKKMIRGPIYSKVRVAIRRDNLPKALLFSIKRKKVFVQTVHSETKDRIFYARISGFNDNSAQSLTKALNAAKSKYPSLQGIVLDLRGNRGGLLAQSIKIADQFLNDGDIIHTKGRHSETLQHYSAQHGDIGNGLPMVILIDGKSASAAEVLAIALQDQGRAVVVGTASFGKGSVQTIIRLPNNGEIVLTWSHLVAPSGFAYHGLGVLPSFCTSKLQGTSGALPETMMPAISADKWRLPKINDEEARNDLRLACKPERRKGNLERRIANKIIENSLLYAQGLGHATASSEIANDPR